MREAVLDASVVLHWFTSAHEQEAVAARSLRDEFEAGALVVLAPPLIHLEILNVCGRRWRWGEDQLAALAADLNASAFELIEPELALVARWVSRGLTAYDAAYVAVAQGTGSPLLTLDESILRVAQEVARGPG